MTTALRLRTNLHQLDGPDFRRALEALAGSRGWHLHASDDPELIAKAAGDADRPLGDPLLDDLLKHATRDFDTWLRGVLRAVADILGREPVLPLTDAERERVRAELRRRRTILVYNFTGEMVDPHQLDALRRLGLIERWTHWPVEAARYGVWTAQNPGQTAGSVTVWLRQAEALPLGPMEKQAIEFARRSAGQYLTQIADAAGNAVTEAALNAERRIVMRRIATGITDRRSMSGLVSDLFWDTKAAGINRDLHRVVRTEIMNSFHLGNHAHIRESAGKAEDPLVYKIVRPGACVDCRRLWMAEDGTPRLYPLSEIEANGDSNYGRKRADWLPVIGITHPNCTDSPLQRYTQGLTDKVIVRIRQEAAKP